MKHADKEKLNIQVRGPERTSNSFICKLIGDALEEAGVADLLVINQFGDSLDKVRTHELGNAAKGRNPLLLTSSVHILPEGPVVDEPIILQSGDRPEDFDDESIQTDEMESLTA